jgi:hypothetical protein
MAWIAAGDLLLVLWIEMIDRKQGIKKGPLGACLSAHGWLTPDGYTVLPMRVPTTISAFEIFMAGSVSRIIHIRQRGD